MFEVVLDLNGLTVPALIARLKAIKNAIAAQPVFVSLLAKLTEFAALIDTLETKQMGIATAKAAVTTSTNERDDAQDLVIEAANALGVAVGNLATTEDQVLAAQLRVKSKPGPKPVPAKPTGLELTFGDEEGELSGQCEGQPGVVDYYEMQYTTTDPNGENTVWHFVGTSKKSLFDLPGLPSGQKVWVQIRACNSRGNSPWSDPACKRVP